MTTLLHDIVVGRDGERTRWALHAISTLERGREWRVMVKENKARRSLDQNAYYHAVVVPKCAKRCQLTEEEMHAVIKHLFLPRVQRTYRGDSWDDPASTTNLNRTEWEVFMEKIKCWAATELDGLVIPDPDPNWKLRAIRDV